MPKEDSVMTSLDSAIASLVTVSEIIYLSLFFFLLLVEFSFLLGGGVLVLKLGIVLVLSLD